MNKPLKKIIIKWIILEAIISLMVLSLTPFLFGSIKPFKASSRNKKAVSITKAKSRVSLALKKATARSAKKAKIRKRARKNRLRRNKKRKRAAKRRGRKGVIRRIQRSFYMQGTHYLEVNGRKVALLKSKKIKLDKYVGKKVLLSGSSKKSIESPKIKVITVSSLKRLKK